MAQYKVPQDVEAEDKLLGPFSFRQLIYLFIAGGLIAAAFALFQIFPLLVIIPVPFILFFLILALPLKKDQPMETYLAALISFYIKPNKRFWNSGQRDSTINIIAPKKVEGPRVRTLSENEASNRLSFLANIIDSEGRSITNNWQGAVRDEYVAEASSTPDMFEAYDSDPLTSRLNENTTSHHTAVVNNMRTAIANAENINPTPPTPPTISRAYVMPSGPSAFTTQAVEPLPTSPIVQPTTPTPQPENPARTAAMHELAGNQDYTVATIAKEARRLKNADDDEVYISLH